MTGGAILLAVDPGLSCGWAIRYPSERYLSGVWNLRGNRFEGGGMRLLRLQNLLRIALDASPEVALVAYEEVRRHLGTDAAHLYGAIVGVLTMECDARRLPYTGVPVGTVKKGATGKGNAGKAEMVAAARERWGVDLAEDEADARWIAEAAALELPGLRLTRPAEVA